MHDADLIAASLIADQSLLHVLADAAECENFARPNHHCLVVVAHDSITAERLAFGRPRDIFLLLEGLLIRVEDKHVRRLPVLLVSASHKQDFVVADWAEL